jgi:Phosphopantetheine attachment site
MCGAFVLYDLTANLCKLQAAASAGPTPSQQAISAEVRAVVATLVGRAVDPEQPLMEAGLDSLGKQDYTCIGIAVAPVWFRTSQHNQLLCQVCGDENLAPNGDTLLMIPLSAECLRTTALAWLMVERLMWHSCTGAVELRNALGDKFNIELPPSLALDFPTASAITTHITSLLAPAAVTVAAYEDFDAAPRRALQGTFARDATEPTAIVGLSARFPSSIRSAAQFWGAISSSANLQDQVYDLCVATLFCLLPPSRARCDGSCQT